MYERSWGSFWLAKWQWCWQRWWWCPLVWDCLEITNPEVNPEVDPEVNPEVVTKKCDGLTDWPMSPKSWSCCMQLKNGIDDIYYDRPLLLPSERLGEWWRDCLPGAGCWPETRDPPGCWGLLRSYHWGLPLRCHCWIYWPGSRILTCSNASPYPISERKPAVILLVFVSGLPRRVRRPTLPQEGHLWVPRCMWRWCCRLPGCLNSFPHSSQEYLPPPPPPEPLLRALLTQSEMMTIIIRSPPLFSAAWQNTNNQLKWETLGSTFTPTCFKLLFFIQSLNSASLATS